SLILIFFYSCYVDPRDLDSFPTRRSSDLLGITTKTCPFGPPSLVGRIGSPTEMPVMVILPMASSGLVRAAGGTTSVFILTSFRSDRKSTRLNSSHVKISYAVFCLKKKIYT